MSSVERLPRSIACASRNVCAAFLPSSRRKEKNGHSALSFEDAPSLVRIVFSTWCMRICAQQRALALARIGDLAQQGHHAQFLQDDGIEGHLIETVEDLAGRCAALPDARSG